MPAALAASTRTRVAGRLRHRPGRPAESRRKRVLRRSRPENGEVTG